MTSRRFACPIAIAVVLAGGAGAATPARALDGVARAGQTAAYDQYDSGSDAGNEAASAGANPVTPESGRRPAGGRGRGRDTGDGGRNGDDDGTGVLGDGAGDGPGSGAAGDGTDPADGRGAGGPSTTDPAQSQRQL